jgi:PAS domain S-box-containing protein
VPALVAAGAAPVLAGLFAARARRRLDAVLRRSDEEVRDTIDRFAESEARYRGLLDAMREGFAVVDLAERVLFANRRFARMLRVPPESLIGLELTCFLTGRNKERLLRQSVRRKAGRAGRYALEWRAADGRRVFTLVSSAPLRTRAGEIIGSFGVVTEVTERRRLMRHAGRAALARAIGEMAGGITHDFNSRLSAVLGNAQLLLLREQDVEKARLLKAIESSAREGAETVRRLHELTRTRHDREVEDIDVHGLLSDLLDLMAYRCRGRARPASAWTIDRDFRATRAVPAWPAALREALINVILNAFDAMPEGGTLRVETRDGPGAVTISIRDTGPGMPDDVVKRIFDPFYTTRGPRRAGLGLPVACAIVHRHKGRLDVASSPGQGTVVTFRLPATERLLGPVTPPALPVHRPTPAPRPAPPPPHRHRILAVDDEEDMLRLLRLALGQRGHEVLTAGSGVDALEILAAGPIDVLVTDLGMPGMPGDELARVARQDRPELRVLLTTGSVDDLPEATGSFDALVRKPFAIPELVETVEMLLPDATRGQSVATG